LPFFFGDGAGFFVGGFSAAGEPGRGLLVVDRVS
jgi:hypothetical protein